MSPSRCVVVNIHLHFKILSILGNRNIPSFHQTAQLISSFCLACRPAIVLYLMVREDAQRHLDQTKFWHYC